MNTKQFTRGLFPVLMPVVLSCNMLKMHAQSDSSAVVEKTIFQTSGPWKPVTDIRADVAVVYGADDRKDMTFNQRVQSWRDKGYITHFMTGIAWGEYQDYFTGKWDGRWHLDEGQVTQKGDTLWHGQMVPYLVPSENFIRYMKEQHIRKAIDAGIDAIYLEEPEFWARAGYSEAFKREWADYYGFDWRPQHESPENTYLSNKLKYHLYYRALEECFTYAKEYGKSKGMSVRCYVPTHSLVNYSQWQIVSPEASLASLPCVDGYIAQVWTGTSREPNYFNGERKERVFETAFLEYGSMVSMTRPTSRKMFFLTDPIEDWPRDWIDYKKNYQATFAAKLLYPENAYYEVMPWPDRIYEGLYRTSATSDERERIPRHYSTQMQVMINALNQMPESENNVSGTGGIAVLMANSLMFQRSPVDFEGYDDPQLSNFYGQVLPLLKRGVPVQTLHSENVSYPETWDGVKMLLMSYSNMKPLSPDVHEHIAEWIKNGGVLVYSGCDTDPYQSALDWWNTGGNQYRAPSEHLFRLLGIAPEAEAGEYRADKGTVVVIRKDPKDYVLRAGGDAGFMDTIKQLYGRNNPDGIEYKNNFYLERGPYDIICVLDESVNTIPFTANGLYVDLFDPELPVLSQKSVNPGEQALLFNLSRVADARKPQVLAAASRIYEERVSKGTYSFLAKSPLNTTNVMRVLLPSKPTQITVQDHEGNTIDAPSPDWDERSRTLKLSFENNPDGVKTEIKW